MRIDPPDRGASPPVGESLPLPLPDGGRRWLGLTGTLLVAMFVSTLPQYSIGVLAPILSREIGFGEAALGLVAGSMYVAAALVARFVGRGFDAVSGRLGLAFLSFTAVASLLMVAGVRSTAGMFAAGILAGVSMGTNNPTTNRLISLHIGAGRRGLAIGVKQTGVKMAQIASGALIPWLALTVGWRRGLVGIAVLTGLGLLAGLAFVPSERGRRPAAASLGDAQVPHPGLRWLQGYSLVMAIGMSAMITYLPLYAVEHLALSLTRAGMVVTLFAATATVTRVLWATAADRRDDGPGVMFVQALGGTAGFALLATTAFIGDEILWPVAVLGGATIGSWNVIAQLTVVAVVEPSRAAAVTGMVQSSFLLGLATGAPLMGIIVYAMDSFAIAWCVMALLCTVAAMLVLRQRRK